MTDDGRFYELPSREQTTLWAPSLRQAVEAEKDVLALDEAVEELDLSALEAQYSRVGHPAYPPGVLLKVLIYGYAIGLRASRQLERACRLDDAFRFLAHGLRPDHTALCRFRHDHPQEFKELFVQTVRLCQAAGLVKLGNVAVDGTKIRANRSAQRLRQARKFVEHAYQAAEAADADLLAHSAAAPTQEAPHAGPAEQTLAPSEGASAPPAADAECEFMKTQEGIKPAYNAQLAVDSAYGVVVAQQLVTAQNDMGQLAGMVAQVTENCNAPPAAASADGGYLNQDSLEQLQRQGVAAYLPLPRRETASFEWVEAAGAHRCAAGRWLKPYRVRGDRQIYRTHGCGGCAHAAACGVKGRFKELWVALPGSAMDNLQRRMSSKRGQEIYAARKQIVEPVFGDFKHNHGFSRFLLHGRIGAGVELSLKCIARNLRIWGRAVLLAVEGVDSQAACAVTGRLDGFSRAMVHFLRRARLLRRVRERVFASSAPLAQMAA
jgi:transposase